MRVSPNDGGCWFCYKKDKNMVFSIEFDCFLHIHCLKEALKKENPEAEIMAEELGVRRD